MSVCPKSSHTQLDPEVTPNSEKSRNPVSFNCSNQQKEEIPMPMYTQKKKILAIKFTPEKLYFQVHTVTSKPVAAGSNKF